MLKSEASNRSSRNWGGILFLIVMAAIVLRVYWAAGLIPKDDAEYAKVAYQMSRGTFDYARYEGSPVVPLRTGIVLPTAASMALFGPGEVQIAAYPLITSVIMILLIYFFAARMFGHQAARIASIIWIFLPMEIELATMVVPEIPVTAFAFLGVYCIHVARSRDDIGQRAKLLHGLAGGLAFGAAWLCKESVAFFAPFCLALILFDLRNSKFRQLATWSGVAVGSLAVLLGEGLFYAIINGDWLYRLTAMHNNYRLYPEYFYSEGARFGFEAGTPFWKAIIKRIAIDGPALIFLNAHFLFLPSFGALAALYGLYRRDSRFYFMAALFVMLVIMFNGFSASLKDYQPLPLFNRYFYAICVPAVILTGGMLAKLTMSAGIGSALRERPESFFWGGIIILMLAAVIAWSTFRKFRDHDETWSAGERYLARVLSPKDRIHTDALSRYALEFFWRYPEKMNILVYGEPGYQLTIHCDDYVLRNHSYNRWLAVNRGTWLTLRGFEIPTVVKDPPRNWRIQWANQNTTLFRVGCGD